MGMGPSPGEVFSNSFINMGTFLTNQRKADSDITQRGIDNARQASRDKVADDVARAQIASSTASTNKNIFDLEKSREEDAKTKDLERVMGMVSRYKPGQPGQSDSLELTPEELKSFSNASVRMSNMPNNIINPEVRARYAADNTLLNKGYSMLDSMAASGQLFTARRGDDPEIDAALDAKERLNPKEPLVRQHRDKEFGEYTLANLEQIGVISGEGSAKTADWFSIKDKNNNFIYEKNKDGTPVMVTDPATGAATPKKVLVPSTFGHTNDPKSKVKFDLSALEQAKGQLGIQLLSLFDRMTPQQQQQIQDNNIATLRSSSSPVAVKFLERWDAKEEGAKVSAETLKFDEEHPNATPEQRRIGLTAIFTKYPAGAKHIQEAAVAARAVAPDKKEKSKPVEKPLGGDRYQQYVIGEDGTETAWGGVYSKRVAGGMEGGKSDKLSPIAAKLFDARTKAIEKLYTVEVGKPMVDPATGETRFATAGDVASVTHSITEYNKQLSSFGVAPFELPVADPDAKVKAWVDSEKMGEKPTKDATIKTELEKKGYSAGKIAALLGNGSSGGMAPQRQQAQPLIRKMTAKDAQTAVGTFKTRNQAITALKNMGFTHDETGRPL